LAVVFAAGLLALLLSPAPALRAQLAPLDAQEFEVNSYTTSSQLSPAVRANADGSFVVVFSSYGSPGGDNLAQSVQARRLERQARRFDASGAPLGAQFQVNTYTTEIQRYPGVAADASGNFVVVWEAYDYSGTDTSQWSVQAQRYDAAGTAQLGQFQVNSYTSGGQLSPSVDADAAGNFVVVWESEGSAGSDSDFYSVQGRRFSAAGAPLGADFQINTYTPFAQLDATVDVEPGGDFIVAWQSFGSFGSDSSSFSIQAQRFDAGGTPLGGQFQVNSYTTGYQGRPALGIAPNGEFVVAWQSAGSSQTDSSGDSIHLQRFDAVGLPLGSELQVNVYTTGNQRQPRLAVDPAGGFLVTWTSAGSFGTDVDAESVEGQFFGADGGRIGDEFQLNSYTTSAQQRAAVASDGAGNFIVSWQSFGSPGGDALADSVQARRYRGALFFDGFESGDTTRWSATVP
jgi:hypothetical protein